ncbi:MAG TPA: LptF/LptG family permease [Rhizomicrobium sp.]
MAFLRFRAPAGLAHGMPRLSLYVFRQLIGPIALGALLMTAMIWLAESLPLLDLVINRGQSAPTFIYLSLLILPSLLVILLPIAFFLGLLVALWRLNSDSELVVMASAGYSVRQLAGPVFLAAGLVMALTYLCGLYLMPASQRALKDKVVDIHADIGAALFNEGDFATPAPGLTVFIRELETDGQIHDILVHDDRDAKRPITYLAQSGVLAQTPAGARLIMFDGTVEQRGSTPAQLSVLKFKSYPINMDQFAGPAHASLRKTNELYLGELLWPFGPGLTDKLRNAYFAEANNRLAQPLYCLAFALIVMAAILRGRKQRGAAAMRIFAACAAAVCVRIAGYGIQGPASSQPSLCFLFYLVPLGGAGLALASLAGWNPLVRFQRQPAAEPVR